VKECIKMPYEAVIIILLRDRIYEMVYLVIVTFVRYQLDIGFAEWF